MSHGKARILFEQGMTHFHNKDYEKAVTYFEESIMEDPENAEALYNLACSYSQIDDKDNALIYMERASRLNPECVEWAKEDREFDSIRNEPLFQNIVSKKDIMRDNGAEEPVVEDETYDDEPVEQEEDEPAYQEDNEFQEAEFEQVEPQPAQVHEPPPKLDDGQPTVKVPQSDLPPCMTCGGIVQEERLSRYHPMIGFGIIIVGMCVSTMMFVSLLGLFGIPVIALGLYLFGMVDDVWVCQNCGAKGSECGQLKSSESELDLQLNQ